MFKCPKCNNCTRTLVDLFLDIPSSLNHGIGKKVISTKEVKIMGADWEGSCIYCTCGWNFSLRKKRNKILMARIKELENFVVNVRDNWDCDNDAHKYGTICRSCDASELLKK